MHSILRQTLLRRVAGLAAAAALPWIAACSRDTADSQIFSVPMAAAAAVEPARVDTGKGKGYAFQIAYPPLPAQWHALDEAIRDFSAGNKREMLAATAEWKPGQPQSTLDLSFDIARRTAGFVSVLTHGDVYTGGAHGMPITASFNLDLVSGKLVKLGDLFIDPAAALNALSDECRHQLEGRYAARLRDGDSAMTPVQKAAQIASMKRWIERGTQPRPENFRIFLIDGLDAPAIGLTVIFPPYQVAAYADGIQQVEVPAKVFYDLLRPEYKAAFAIDTEAQKPGAGVR